MVLIHKLFKKHSLLGLSERLPQVATASVFLACKVRYMPVALDQAAQAHFMLQLKLVQAAAKARAGVPVLTPGSFTKERRDHYKGLIEAEEHILLEAADFDLEALDHLPYGAIRAFCEAHVPFASREHLHGIAQAFCNDSFKLPLCLYYHPKVIAAACLQSAMAYRGQHGCVAGIERIIEGHPWFKWVDAAIEQADIVEVVGRMKVLYAKGPASVAGGPPSSNVPVGGASV